MSCVALPSLPTGRDNLAGTAATDKQMQFPHPARSRTLRAIRRAKAPKCAVFPESFATVGQLPDMARRGYPCEKRLTSALFWPWANSLPWPGAPRVVGDFAKDVCESEP